MRSDHKRTDISVKMVALADKLNFPPSHELRQRADEFDTAADGYYSDPQTVPVQKFMGAWARARRTWCQYSGEPLIS